MPRPDVDRSVSIQHDANNNVIVTGDNNDVKVTVVVVDRRLEAPPSSRAGAALDNPYRGLDAFHEPDSSFFFGRDDLITRLWVMFRAIQREPRPRLLPLIGPSGSGKSSLIRAGLIPELVRQPMEGELSPTVLVLRPGSDPLQRLADVLQKLSRERVAACVAETVHEIAVANVPAKSARLVIVVDQLEEVFTECTDSFARERFLETLEYAASHADGLVTVVFTIRSDFVGAFDSPPGFAQAIRERRFPVHPMLRDSLREAICAPAEALGHPWPAAFADALVGQADGRVGALPLVQFALKRLWPEHVAGHLEEAEWSSRLIEDFLVQAADLLFTTSGDDAHREKNQRIIRRAFLRMVQLGEGTADTRRVARMSEIVAADEDPEYVRTILAPFTAPEARLVTTAEESGEPTYELTHEALIMSWERLRVWLGNVSDRAESQRTRSNLRGHRRLSQAARDWKTQDGNLWKPPELDLLRRMRLTAEADFTREEREFVNESFRAWDAEQQRARDTLARERRRRNFAIGAAGVIGVVFAILSTLAWNQAKDARRNLARAYLVQAQGALANRDILGAEDLFWRSLRLEDTKLAREGLLDTRSKGVVLQWTWDSRLTRPAIHGGLGAELYVASTRDGRAVVRRPTEPSWQQELEAPGHKLSLVAFSASGSYIGGGDETGGISIWRVAGFEALKRVSVCEGPVVAMAFNRSDTLVAGACSNNVVVVVDLQTGTVRARLKGHDDLVLAVTFVPGASAGDVSLATASRDRRVLLWHIGGDGSATSELVGDHDDVVESIAANADGTMLATGAKDLSVRLWSIPRGGSRVLSGHQSGVMSVAFSPDGRLVAAGIRDRSVRVWDVRLGKQTLALRGHLSPVSAVAFLPDGTLISADQEGTVRAWGLGVPVATVKTLKGHTAPLNAVTFSKDGQHIASGGHEKTIRVWSALTGTEEFTLPGNGSNVCWLAFDATGTLLASAHEDGHVFVWSLATRTLKTTLPVHKGSVWAVAFDAEGHLASADSDGVTHLWNLADSSELKNFAGEQTKVLSLAFDEQGNRFASGDRQGGVRIWDMKNSTSRLLSGHEAAVWGLAFSPDSPILATGSEDGTVRLWDTSTAAAPRVLSGHEGEVWAIAYGHKGLIASGSDDGTVRLWRYDQATPAVVTLRDRDYTVSCLSFSPDDERLAVAGLDLNIRVWNIREIEEFLASPVEKLLGER